MATPVIDRQTNAPRDPWATAPVAVGRHRHRAWWGALLVLLVVAGALAFLVVRRAPATAPSTPAGPEPDPPQAVTSVPFDVTVEISDVATMDNDGLFGQDMVIPEGAAAAASQQVERTLQDYLDAEFVTPETRFSQQPLADLLSRRALAALPANDTAGLGALEVSVRQVRAEPVGVTAQVLTSGPDAAVVVVRYDARAQVVTDDGDTVPLRQQATMVFVPEDGQWRAEAVNAVLDLPLPTGEVAR